MSQNQVFMKWMFVLKESKDKFKRKDWVFLSEHSRKWEIYFVFCGIEHLHHVVCSVIEINICSEDLQEVVIDKTIKKNFTAIKKGYFDRCSMKKLFLKIFFAIFSGKHLCWSFFLRKSQAFRPATIKKRLQHRYFPVNIAKPLRTRISKNIRKMLVIKRNHWNVLSIFMLSCTNLHYKYAQSNSYHVLNLKSVKITDMKSTLIWISYHF